jgi:hypothetical protein
MVKMPPSEQLAVPTSAASAKPKKSNLPLAPDYAQIQNRISLSLAKLESRFATSRPGGLTRQGEAAISGAKATTKDSTTEKSSRSGFSALKAKSSGERAAPTTPGSRPVEKASQARTRREIEDEQAALLAESLPPNAGIGSLGLAAGKDGEFTARGQGSRLGKLSADDENLRRRLLGRRPRDVRPQQQQDNDKSTGGSTGKDGVSAKKRRTTAIDESDSEEEKGRSALGRQKRRRDG